MLKYSDNARSRIQDGLRKYSRIVAQARQRGMNDRDTGDIVRAMLGDMLGYDPFFDVTAEIRLRGPNANYAVLVEGQLRLLVVVKPLGVLPNATHLLRLSGANAPPYADWALLTNADTWACYRLGVGPDRHAELVFRASLQDSQPLEEKTALFFLLCKEGVEQDALALYWEQMRVLHPGRLASILLSEDILNLIRRELHRIANYRVDLPTLQEILIREVIRHEALASRTYEDIGSARLPQCFAYVPDPNAPLTWRLRYRNSDNTPNPELLTQAVAELSRASRTLGIPADDVPLVRQRLRQAYLELGISLDDLPDPLRQN